MDEESLFAAAVELSDPGERQAFLDEACGGDHSLRARLERLLAGDGYASSILFRGPATLLEHSGSAPLAAGALLDGRFELRQRLGAGGMGEVWVADQLEPVQRRIALKIIRPGLHCASLIARFGQECQALARMDHPGIAKVLDAGTAEDGRPYFVMELVRGVPITEYCDSARLSPRDRLELFAPVCQAVQHAHQKGIIHRDIKPANVLVALYDGKPVVKVIDFGIAKATGERLSEHSGDTEAGAVVGTLEYMSPEQAELNNLDIDTRSDVYSLGVLLYELLTGRVPNSGKELRSVPYAEMLRIIKEVEPLRPSARLTCDSETLAAVAAARRTEPKRLLTLVRGELDWIVMKCLEKDRARRYETANGLAVDLQRYLADEVVVAGPPSAAYRLRKFVRRNRGPVLATSLLLLALVGGIVGTTIGLVRAEQARRAERERAEGERRAKETAEKRLAQIETGIGILGSIFENLDPQAEEKEGRPLRAILGDRLNQAAAALEGEAVGDALVVAGLQDRLGRTYLSLGNAAEAEALFGKALATRQARLGPDHRDTLGSMSDQALAYQAAGKLPQAIERFEQLRDAQTRKLGADHPETLTTLNYLGVAYRLGRRPAEAVALLAQVRDERARRLGADHPDTLTTLNCLALAYRANGRLAEAIALYEQVRDARVKRLGPEHPDTLTTLHHLVLAYRQADRLPEAIAMHEELRDAQLKRLGPEHPHTLTTLHNLAKTYRMAGKWAEAISLYEQVRDARMRKLESDQLDAFLTLNDLAEAYAFVGSLEQALRLCHQAALVIEKRGFAHPEAARVVHNLSHCYELSKQYDKAEAWRRKWLAAVKDRDGPESVAYAEELAELGWNLLMQAKYADAEPLLLQGYEGMKKRKGEIPLHDRFRLIDALMWLEQLYDAWGRPGEAARWRKELEKAKAPP